MLASYSSGGNSYCTLFIYSALALNGCEIVCNTTSIIFFTTYPNQSLRI